MGRAYGLLPRGCYHLSAGVRPTGGCSQVIGVAQSFSAPILTRSAQPQKLRAKSMVWPSRSADSDPKRLAPTTEGATIR